MGKMRMMPCRHCKIDTKHKVRRVCYKPHSSGSKGGGTKYLMEHCTVCGKRWYNGKSAREMKVKIAAHIGR